MDTLLGTTTSLCATCKRAAPAEIWRLGERVVMRKTCDAHGAAEVLLSPNADWYEAVLAHAPVLQPPEATKPVSQGCPFDCGPCTSHEQTAQLPIVPITSACNLDCPICYTHNKNGAGAYHMTERELGAILEHLRRADPERRIINITGGEPTQHPQFERLIELCAEAGIHRITVSTHGLRFLKDERILERLAALRARIVLSFDSFDAETNQQMLGGQFLDGKLRVLELLEKYGVDTTLLPVLVRGTNDHEVGAFVRLALSKDFIRSVELHTMTFTGGNGTTFDRVGRYTTYEVLQDLERQTAGALRVSDFVPSPAAHPLCYLVTYVLRLDDGRWLPFPRFMEPADLRELLAGMLYLEPTKAMEAKLADIVTRLWAGDLACDDTDLVLDALRALADDAFAPGLDPRERLRRAETRTKAIYIHSHMDEDTFDTDRIRQCCVGIREPDGTNIPSCAYNTLYRDRDARFTAKPAAPLVQLGRGRVLSASGRT
ncbi:MAG TPA: radical SAM protein [Kofleriaceae bacterium]|nr:radical SAM protein [Kofleriaceae bacterium]